MPLKDDILTRDRGGCGVATSSRVRLRVGRKKATVKESMGAKKRVGGSRSKVDAPDGTAMEGEEEGRKSCRRAPKQTNARR